MKSNSEVEPTTVMSFPLAVTLWMYVEFTPVIMSSALMEPVRK